MKKITATNTEVHEPKLEYTVAGLEAVKMNLKFPSNPEHKRSLASLRQNQERIASYQSYNTDYLHSIEGNNRAIRKWESEIESIRSTLPAGSVATPDEMKAELESVAKLAWVEKVELDGSFIVVTTRKDMLKTQFNVRLVLFPRDRWTLEHLPEPVLASMPQYQIRIDTNNLGNSYSNNRYLGIRLIDLADVSHYQNYNLITHEAHPHWGSNGATGVSGNWAHLCFGEYANDIQVASAKGLAALFIEISVYLQNAGDAGNAYRTKQNWALGLGKALYYEFITRKAKASETKEGIEEQYKKDFKMMNQVPGARTAPPVVISGLANLMYGNNMASSNLTAEQALRLTEMLYAPTEIEEADSESYDEG